MPYRRATMEDDAPVIYGLEFQVGAGGRLKKGEQVSVLPLGRRWLQAGCVQWGREVLGWAVGLTDFW